MNFEFGAPGRIIFGDGQLSLFGELAAEFGKRAFVLTGRSSLQSGGASSQIGELLQSKKIMSEFAHVAGEPTVGAVDDLAISAREFAPDLIVAVGGGSVLDAGKAIAALLPNGNGTEVSVVDFLEGVGKGRKIVNPPIPLIAIPTTAGTGAEVTKNAVIRSDDRRFKKSMRSPLMRPRIALVDPLLTHSASPEITASCGLDAMTQLIEAFTSPKAGPLTDGLAREGLRLIVWALERAYNSPQDHEARSAMAMASLLSGLALDNAGLGAVHGLAAPIGGMFDVPHGVVCANLLPEITQANVETASRNAPRNDEAMRTLGRYEEIARLFNGDFHCEAQTLGEVLRAQRRMMKIPPLGAYGITEGDIPRILGDCRGGSMKTNPFDLNDEVLREVLLVCLGEFTSTSR